MLIADNHSPLSYGSAPLLLIVPGDAQYRLSDLHLTSLTDFEVCLSIHLIRDSKTFPFLWPKLQFIYL
jgi:hypothetical protein